MSAKNNTVELKNCPFCGSHRIELITRGIQTVKTPFRWLKLVSCTSCRVETKKYKHIGWAIRAWNKRS